MFDFGLRIRQLRESRNMSKKSWKKMNVTDVPMENVVHVSVSVTNQ